jgi:hypothetical protein
MHAAARERESESERGERGASGLSEYTMVKILIFRERH